MEPLSRDFYGRDTKSVARDLLGCVLETRWRGRLTSGRIVEVEAYVGPHDPAAHGYEGHRTARTEALFGPPGLAYVFFTYGMHWCANAVTEAADYPAAVLIRALEPLEGIDIMRDRRGTESVRALCSGPAKLCQALAISGTHNRRWLDDDRFRIVGPPDRRVDDIATGPRIGISRAVDWPLRFVVRGSSWLSRPG